MLRSVKLIPVTMLAAFLLLGLKVGEVLHDGRSIILSFTEEAHAQQTPPAPAPSATTPAPTPTAAATAATPAPATASGKPADSKSPESKTETTGGSIINPATSDEEGDAQQEESAKRQFSQVEIDLLQSLAKRRQELDEWSKQVQLKENMLIAIEGRIDEKTKNLERMKKEVQDLLDKYNEQEDIKIKSLVKIYESMKPKDAARIFEELDMPVLLMVVDRMSERKVGAILAQMSPSKAKDVTEQLAEQRKLQKNRPGIEASPQADATSSANSPPSSPATQR